MSKSPPEMANVPPSPSAQSPRAETPDAFTRTVPPEIAMLPHLTAYAGEVSCTTYVPAEERRDVDVTFTT